MEDTYNIDDTYAIGHRVLGLGFWGEHMPTQDPPCLRQLFSEFSSLACSYSLLSLFLGRASGSWIIFPVFTLFPKVFSMALYFPMNVFHVLEAMLLAIGMLPACPFAHFSSTILQTERRMQTPANTACYCFFSLSICASGPASFSALGRGARLLTTCAC